MGWSLFEILNDHPYQPVDLIFADLVMRHKNIARGGHSHAILSNSPNS